MVSTEHLPSPAPTRKVAEPAPAVHRLAWWNRERFTPGAELPRGEEDALRSLELDFVDTELAAVRPAAALAPSQADALVRWFEQLEHGGPGQGDPLFEWLATTASRDDMIWFLRQEVAGEAGFDDLVALTQVKMPERAKLELARNYWDEMGQGQATAMHGPMLAALATELAIEHPKIDEVVPESLALANLMVGLAMNRRHAYRSLGALGVIELTAPGRARKVNEGLKRLGLGGEARRYYALHATLDVKHSLAWNQEILQPLVEAHPELATPIAEGALARLNAGARCFARYRSVLFANGAPSY